jgi:hypothetical protein
MSKKLKFVWIDDEDRKKDARNLEKQIGVKCEFLDVKRRELNYLSEVDRIQPDLILVDHNLVNIAAGEIRKGSTIAVLIREKHPTYAIACVTGQDANSIDTQQRLSYEAIFSYDDLKHHNLTMKAIATGYRKLKEKRLRKISDLFNLMKAPKLDHVRLETILPGEIRENFADHGIFANVSHWIRDTIMERPGFLYDRLWASTLLGLNDSGFEKIEDRFAKAKYKGIFTDKSKDRWWRSELINILSSQVKGQGLPWEKGRHLPGINSRNFSRDYFNGEDYPEVVAYTDETSNERVQMKLKHTVLHPSFNKLLFFDDVRMMNIE